MPHLGFVESKVMLAYREVLIIYMLISSAFPWFLNFHNLIYEIASWRGATICRIDILMMESDNQKAERVEWTLV